MIKKQLFPVIEPYVTHSLEVGHGHCLHVEECGRPDGVPVLFLHGGPGSGCSPFQRRFFDPDKYHIVLFDQRGCGKSTPHASLDHNTTWDLVADIEFIRSKLNISQWVVFGGSWGSTLALAYAETYPQRVLGLILRGIFLCRTQDIHWFYQQGASEIFPDIWEHYIKPIPKAKRDNLLEAYYKILTGEDEIARMSAAKAWSIWEGSVATLIENRNVITHFADSHLALSLARIECHYFVHHSFLEPNQLIRDVGRLESIPATLVHGRYDVICPVRQAWDLSRAWPQAKLEIIPDAGHYATEPGIVDALIRTTNEMANLLL